MLKRQHYHIHDTCCYEKLHEHNFRQIIISFSQKENNFVLPLFSFSAFRNRITEDMNTYKNRKHTDFPSNSKNSSARGQCNIPFTSPTIPQQTLPDNVRHRQQTQRRKASIGQENESDLLRRSKRRCNSSANHNFWSISLPEGLPVAPMVTPSPRIMHVAAQHHVTMSPISKAVSSTRKKASARATKSRRVQFRQKYAVSARNKEGKKELEPDTRRNAPPVFQRIPIGVPNIFSPSGAIDLLDSSLGNESNALKSEMSYWCTYGLEYYENLSLVEAEKRRDEILTSSGNSCKLGKSTVCTRSMSKKIDEHYVENYLECKSKFYQIPKKMPTTDSHEYIDEFSGDCERTCWDSSFPQHRDLTPFMRTILTHWLLEVGQCYHLVPETLHLTVKLIDSVLALGLLSFGCPYKARSARQQTNEKSQEVSSSSNISKASLQCIGSACMLIASKIEEINPPSASDFALMSGDTFSVQDILSMELQICLTLKFDLHITTPLQFLESYLHAACYQGQQTLVEKQHLKHFSLYLLELSLLEYSFTQFPSSMLAASAVYLAKIVLLKSSAAATMKESATEMHKKKYWDETLVFYTGYSVSELKEPVKRLFSLHNKAESAPIHQTVFLRHQQNEILSESLLVKLSLQDLFSKEKR